jgi:peroxiredoxin
MRPLPTLLGPARVVCRHSCWIGWQLLRQNGRILLRLERLEQQAEEKEHREPAGLAPGLDAPGFELPDLAGQHRSLVDFRGVPRLLIFFNPDCGFCQELAPKLAERQIPKPNSQQTEGAGRPVPLILSIGDPGKNRRFFAEQKLGYPVLVQPDTEVAAAYRAAGTPSGYVIDEEGKIASELVIGGEALLALLTEESRIKNQKSEIGQSLLTSAPTNEESGRADRFNRHSLAQSKIKRDGLAAGTIAPEFRLPRLDGGELSLSELRGQLVLLVFSSPHCGPCHTLAPSLERFHRKHPIIQLVMITRGGREENRQKVREHGLTFPIVLQKQWEISRKYALFASPVGPARTNTEVRSEPIRARRPAATEFETSHRYFPPAHYADAVRAVHGSDQV